MYRCNAVMVLYNSWWVTCFDSLYCLSRNNIIEHKTNIKQIIHNIQARKICPTFVDTLTSLLTHNGQICPTYVDT